MDYCPESGVCIKVCALHNSDINNYLKIDDDNCFECGLCFMNCSKEVLSK